MKNIVITGATSFIGINLIKELLLKDVKIYAVIRPGSYKAALLPRSSKIIVVQANMDDYNKLSSYIPEPCDCFVHLAWSGTRGNDRMDKSLQYKNYECSMETIWSSFKLNCRIFISAGSQAEYGTHNYAITEDSACCPNTEYGKHKLKFYENAMKLCKENSTQFKEPRFFSLYGPEDFDGTMIMSTLKKMVRDEKCEFTESKQTWDFLYITDAAKGIVKLMETNCPAGAYNLGSGLPRMLKDYINDMYQLTKSKSKLCFGAIQYPETGVVSIQPCIDKMKKETAWVPVTTFKEGILNILKSMKCEENDENN